MLDFFFNYLSFIYKDPFIKFNLLPNLVFLVGLYRPIPIGKTYHLLGKTFKGNVKGNTLDNICIILTGGKTLLDYYFKILPLYKRVSKMPILPCLLFKLFTISIYYLYKIIYLSFP